MTTTPETANADTTGETHTDASPDAPAQPASSPLIVLGSRGGGGWSRQLLGSVSGY
jgi:nucleotide-binding universal stress UspA family protein